MSAQKIPSLGSLRNRVQLLRKNQSVGAEGGHTNTYLPLATVWARVRSLSGTLGALVGGRTVKASHTIVIRYRTDLSPGDRIIYRALPLEIISLDDLNGHRAYLSCRCVQTETLG